MLGKLICITIARQRQVGSVNSVTCGAKPIDKKNAIIPDTAAPPLPAPGPARAVGRQSSACRQGAPVSNRRTSTPAAFAAGVAAVNVVGLQVAGVPA